MKRYMKLIAIGSLAALALNLFAACGGDSADAESPSPETQSSETGAPETPEPESQAPEGTPANADAPTDAADLLWDIPEDASDEEIINLTIRNFKVIQAFEPLYTEDSYTEYYNAYSKGFKRLQTVESALEAVEAQSLLVQQTSVEDGVWFLWGDSVGPVVDGESYTEEELDAVDNQDAYGFRPFLIKYLLDDPTTAKGNIIMISGGGFTQRSNPAEGYPAAELFREMGYNTFLLQRRVAPYSGTDIFMDMQRAIRIVRYYAEEEGWGGQDMIAAAGFSGGGGTILGAIAHCYGELTPVDVGATSYVADEIDAVSSDLDVAMIIYGSVDPTGSDLEELATTIYGSSGVLETENTDFPAFYICHGTADEMIPYENAVGLYDYVVAQGCAAKLYTVEGAKHGFGVGLTSTAAEGCDLWPGQADEFMQSLRE